MAIGEIRLPETRHVASIDIGKRHVEGVTSMKFGSILKNRFGWFGGPRGHPFANAQSANNCVFDRQWLDHADYSQLPDQSGYDVHHAGTWRLPGLRMS